jgi:hypothetical protein
MLKRAAFFQFFVCWQFSGKIKFDSTLFIMDQFITPKMSKLRSALQCDKPVIPESPLMAKLGYGTGNFVFQ